MHPETACVILISFVGTAALSSCGGIARPDFSTGTGGTPGDANGDGEGDTGGMPGGEDGDGGCVERTTRPCGAAPLGLIGTCAEATAVCQDGEWTGCPDPKAADSCEPGNDDTCNGTPNEGCECVNAADCDDEHHCTRDTCSEGACRNEISSGQCLIDDTGCVPSDYVAEHDTCLACSPTTDQTGWTEAPNCECGTDADCDDGLPCTVDTCSDNSCTYLAAANSCLIDGQCLNSGDAQADDACNVCNPSLDPSRWSAAECGNPFECGEDAPTVALPASDKNYSSVPDASGGQIRDGSYRLTKVSFNGDYDSVQGESLTIQSGTIRRNYTVYFASSGSALTGAELVGEFATTSTSMSVEMTHCNTTGGTAREVWGYTATATGLVLFKGDNVLRRAETYVLE